VQIVKPIILFLFILTILQTLVLTILPEVLAQENSIQRNIDLNGVWQRDDGAIVYITHTGSQVVATFKEEGTCSYFGVTYEPHRHEFFATIEDNQLIGKVYLCDLELNNVIPSPVGFDITDGGNQLIGNVNGEFRSYVRMSTPPTTEIGFLPGELQRFTSGYIGNPDTNKIMTPVAMGSFTATYLETSGVNPTLFFGALAGTLATIIGASSYAAVKNAHTKHIKLQEEKSEKQEERQKINVIRLAIEFGLEAIDRTGKRIAEIRQVPYDEDSIRIGQESKRVLEAIFESRQKLRKLQEATEFVKWCKDAKEDPDKIVSKISDDIIASLLDCIEPYFSYFLLDGITIETESNIIENRNNGNPNKEIADVENDKGKERNVQFNTKFALKPLEPFIKFTLLIDEIPTSSLSLIFIVQTDVNIKNAKLYSKANSGSKSNGSAKGITIEIEKMLIVLNLSFSRFVISHYLNNSIEMPISLGTKEFAIERAQLVLPQ
jgi:hypothetical protein